MSKGERNRIKTRVRSAMASQAAIEGRFLGGRPPYGYVLVDAGPHPNPSKAATGQQLRRLEPDPKAAPIVRRIFTEFLVGQGLYAIAERLTADGILSPSAHDPDRNRHRSNSKGAWSKSAVRAILRNPRYTGYQVWNRQARHEILIDVEDVALGHDTKMSWNEPSQWIWSEEPTHEPLVTMEQFEAVQQIFRGASRSATRREKTKRGPYILSGMMRCGVCSRRMQGSWNHDQPYYRCKFPAEYAIAEHQHPKTIYVKEAAITPSIDRWLAQLFDDERIDDTCAALEAIHIQQRDDYSGLVAARRTVKTCDNKLAKYRQALEAGTDPSIVGNWIEEIKLEKKAAELQLRRTPPILSKDDIRSLVLQSKGIVEILAQADPEDRRAVYQELGVSITYHRDGRLHVSAGPAPCTNNGVGGGT
ncbi:MAG: recombinase family protein [Acidimicrobiia bacterium]|nr:recombinase family protein [Acidimicrobiia bacterium]